MLKLYAADSADDSKPLLTSTSLVTNGVDLPVVWGATSSGPGNTTAVSKFAGTPVRMVMVLQDCNLFGFRFVD